MFRYFVKLPSKYHDNNAPNDRAPFTQHKLFQEVDYCISNTPTYLRNPFSLIKPWILPVCRWNCCIEIQHQCDINSSIQNWYHICHRPTRKSTPCQHKQWLWLFVTSMLDTGKLVCNNNSESTSSICKLHGVAEQTYLEKWCSVYTQITNLKRSICIPHTLCSTW